MSAPRALAHRPTVNPPRAQDRALRRGRFGAALRVLFWLALALRLWFVLVSHPTRNFVFSDMQSYHAVAIDLLRGQSNPWHAFRPVGYSLLLALSYALSDGSPTLVGVLQALLGAALVPLSFELARQCGARSLTALLCAACAACSVPLVFYCGLLLTELPSSFFLLFGITRVLRFEGARGASARRSCARGCASIWWGGLALGTAVALRPNLLLLLPAILAYALWITRGPTLRRPGRVRLGLLALGVLVPVLCVSAYNSSALGRPVGPATNGGLNFYLNFADVHTIQYRGAYGGYWVSPVPNGFHHTRHELTHAPFFDERHYYRAGWRVLGERPAALRSALGNFVEAAGLGRQLYWPNWPGHEPLFRGYARAFFAGVLLPALLMLAALCWPSVRRSASPALLLLATCCALGLVPIYFFLGDPRVRVPFDPLWIVLAGLAFQHALRRLNQLRTPLADREEPTTPSVETRGPAREPSATQP